MWVSAGRVAPSGVGSERHDGSGSARSESVRSDSTATGPKKQKNCQNSTNTSENGQCVHFTYFVSKKIAIMI